MIFYFSGTGNSLHCARMIAKVQNEKLLFIPKELESGNLEYELGENELLGFVFPVYAWAPPKIVIEFIRKMKFKSEIPYIFMLSTCGDEEGNTTEVFQNALMKKGLKLDSAFTIRMPNNYIIGADVDSKEAEQSKLEVADKKLAEINEVLKSRKSGVFKLIQGNMAEIKTAFINPLFCKFAVNTKKFFVTDACGGCGICEKVCPLHTIKVTQKPVWGKECTQCFACLHRCPTHAIQFGSGTLNKGRYVYPKEREEDQLFQDAKD